MDEEQVRVTVELVDTETDEMSLNGDLTIERATSEAGSSDEDEDEEEEMEGEDETEQDVTMEEKEEPAVPSPRPGIVVREKRKQAEDEPLKKAPVYLKRNTKPRQSAGTTFADFIHYSGTYNVTAEKTRMASDTMEGFIYNERPTGAELVGVSSFY